MAPLEAGASGRGIVIGSALAGSQNWGVPADFDSQGFLNAAKTNFVTLQAAWDKSDVNALRIMMTDDMLREIRTQLDGFGQQQDTRMQAFAGQLNELVTRTDQHLATLRQTLLEETRQGRQEGSASQQRFSDVQGQRLAELTQRNELRRRERPDHVVLRPEKLHE